jgi:hypothetical protein
MHLKLPFNLRGLASLVVNLGSRAARSFPFADFTTIQASVAVLQFADETIKRPLTEDARGLLANFRSIAIVATRSSHVATESRDRFAQQRKSISFIVTAPVTGVKYFLGRICQSRAFSPWCARRCKFWDQ